MQIRAKQQSEEWEEEGSLRQVLELFARSQNIYRADMLAINYCRRYLAERHLARAI